MNTLSYVTSLITFFYVIVFLVIKSFILNFLDFQCRSRTDLNGSTASGVVNRKRKLESLGVVTLSLEIKFHLLEM